MQEHVNIPDSTITSELTFRNLVLMNMQQLTNFPYIEKDFDALTDYELLCLVVKFLNDVIINQNAQNASITNMYNAFLALQTYVNNIKDTLETAFNSLDDYVRNYFANLDVQEEVNNKLDQMLEDGVLEQIIEQYLQSTALWCFDTISSMKSATNLINGSYTKTLGYYELNDGGGATYKILSDEPTGYYETLNNGLYAKLIINDYIYPKQFGCYGDGTHDDTTKFHLCLDYAITNDIPIKVLGDFVINDSYELQSTNKKLVIIGESIKAFRSTNWQNGNISRIKLTNGASLLKGNEYYTSNNALPWLMLTMKGINFYNEYTSYNEAYNNQFIINDIRLTSSIIDSISTQCLNFMRGSFNRSSILKNSNFIACYIFMQRGSEGDMISDSVIADNYISGSDTGYTFDKHTGASVRFNNNYVDYFKYIFSPTTFANSFLSYNNVYDTYFHIFEPTTDTNYLYANFISQNDKYHPHNKTTCVNKGWMTNDEIKTSFAITTRSFNIQIINPQIRMPDGNEGDDVFMYGDIYGPTSKALTIKIINPTYWTPNNSSLTKEPVLSEIMNVKNSGATLEQHFNNTQISYQSTIVDRVSSLPDLTRDTRYIVPPFYQCYNTTDNKLYMFKQSGSFVEI